MSSNLNNSNNSINNVPQNATKTRKNCNPGEWRYPPKTGICLERICPDGTKRNDNTYECPDGSKNRINLKKKTVKQATAKQTTVKQATVKQATVKQATRKNKKSQLSVLPENEFVLEKLDQPELKLELEQLDQPNLEIEQVEQIELPELEEEETVQPEEQLVIEEQSVIEEQQEKQKPLELPEEATCNTNLQEEFGSLDCTNENYYTSECNKFLLKKELTERKCIEEDENERTFLYPNLNDKEFNIKIAEKKEFNDTKYDGEIHTDIKDYADKLSKLDFELQPHQQFVKNFLSSQTPYNSLLLFHGLGTGKTLSSIGVCEEMREYMKQSGLTKRIIIVASENVQDNFKLQLFDERKLTLINGIWNIKYGIGNKLIKEINPTNIKGIAKEKIVSQIKNLINSNYIFLGYGQFANYIIKTMYRKDDPNTLSKKIMMKRLRNEFDERLIVIDEIHNIRISEDNQDKKVAEKLEVLVKSAMNMRLVFLSATPMYNNYTEIIWLLNIMNMNDRRAKIQVSDVFDKNGNFKPNGEDLLIRKATGYVSFVRGENPYTFPYRVYPDVFDKKHTFPYIKYPTYQMNLTRVPDDSKDRILSLYLTTINDCNKCGGCQYCIYKYIISHLRQKEYRTVTKKGKERNMPSFQNMDKFGYTILQNPLFSLIISYPYDEMKDVIMNVPDDTYKEIISEDSNSSSIVPTDIIVEPTDTIVEPTDIKINITPDITDKMVAPTDINMEKPIITTINEIQKGGFNLDPNELTNIKGLERMMDFTNSPQQKGDFSYKNSTLKKYGKIFSYDKIGKYSSKIKCLLDSIQNHVTYEVSKGVILVYSQYIDAGLIPIALALEEMGFTRYGNNTKPLFKTPPTAVVDVRTMKPPTDRKNFLPARYAMITGTKLISPDNDYEVKGITDKENMNGEKVKIVLISRAGSEGIDFKFIRQVHIMDPWYNMNRIEQIIGRAVRNFSHKDLEFDKRNVQIFMHGTILGKNIEEAADLYVYRFAELKAIQIGKVSRLLKETAVDCIINHDQTNFTQEKIMKWMEKPVVQKLSTGKVIPDFKIGDAPYSPACDYMETCDYSCRPNKDNIVPNEDTYNEQFMYMNNDKIKQRIRMFMKEGYFYKKDVLIALLQAQKKYPLIQIYACLTQLIDDESEIITDKYGRDGRLVNIDDYYLFQPLELTNKNVSIFDRVIPIDYKQNNIEFVINKELINQSRLPVAKEKDFDHMLERTDKENTLITKLKQNYDLAQEYTRVDSEIKKGMDYTWYNYAGIVITKLKVDYPDMDVNYLLASHIIEELFYKEKLELMNYLYSLDNNITRDTFLWYMKKYFNDNIIKTKKNSFFILYDLTKMKIVLLNGNNEWVHAKSSDISEMNADAETNNLKKLNKNDYNQYVGFLGHNKKKIAIVFKTIDMNSDRNTGATCETAGKNNTMDKINLILGEKKYTDENTKLKKDKNGKVINEAINQTELCVIQEFILRYFNNITKNGKKWFLTPEMVLYYKL